MGKNSPDVRTCDVGWKKKSWGPPFFISREQQPPLTCKRATSVADRSLLLPVWLSSFELCRRPPLYKVGNSNEGIWKGRARGHVPDPFEWRKTQVASSVLCFEA